MSGTAFARLRGTIAPAIAALSLILAPSLAKAQAVPLQAGPAASGRVPMYSGAGVGLGQPVIQDSGPASGGQPGLGLNELLLQQRGFGAPPYANAGSGPLGTNLCDYDGPTTGPFHYLCLGPNGSGSGAIVYGAGGGAAPQALTVTVNGVPFTFPANGSVTPGGGTIATLPYVDAGDAKALSTINTAVATATLAQQQAAQALATAKLPLTINLFALANGIQATLGGI